MNFYMLLIFLTLVFPTSDGFVVIHVALGCFTKKIKKKKTKLFKHNDDFFEFKMCTFTRPHLLLQ